MKEYFNCFVGVPLNLEFKYEFEQIQKKLQSLMPNASVVEPHNAHLTLHFLGTQNLKNLEEIAHILYEEKDVIGGEELKIGDRGIFYRKNHFENVPYIVYLKVTHTTRLFDFKKHLSSHLDSYNKEDERSFVPHVTLARLKTTESESQYKEHSADIDDLLSEIKLRFRLKEIFIYGKPNPDSSGFPEVLFKVSLI